MSGAGVGVAWCGYPRWMNSGRAADTRDTESGRGRAATKGWDRAEVTSVAGTRVHAAVLGPSRGRTVVCVHGLGCSHRYFLPVARHLAPAVTVVAPDLPGFGRTPGPREPLGVRGLSTALADWLRATGRQGALLLANSAGCQLVVDLAEHAPDVLGPAVLVGPSVDADARTPARQLVRLLADVPWERPALIPLLARDYLGCGPRRLLATARALLHDPVEDKLAHLHTPTVVVRGGRDPIAPRSWARRIAAGLPNGRLAEVPGAGHALNYSAPRELAAIVSDVLAG